jgi:hypothetical protein
VRLLNNQDVPDIERKHDNFFCLTVEMVVLGGCIGVCMDGSKTWFMELPSVVLICLFDPFPSLKNSG